MPLLVECPIKPEVQGLQAFAFFVVTVNDEHTNLGSKKAQRLNLKKVYAPAELCLKFLFESDWYFFNITKSGF